MRSAQRVVPVTGLSDAEFRTVPGIEWRVRAEYAWDAGRAMGTFLKGLKQGRIMATTCRVCGRTMVPPRAFCEECFRPTDGWREVGPGGHVYTFSVCHVAWDMRRLPVPEIPAVIRLDGASPGMGLLHLLGEVEPSRVQVGMRVEAVFRPPEERVGAITDILHFRPVS
jgi:uncharacterized OB-fold protein